MEIITNKYIFRYLFVIGVIIIVVSCSKSSKSSSIDLPEYKLISISEPKVSSNGYISPTQNLEYKIEIKQPLEKDSLELLQNYFIKKGIEDYSGVNKIIVSVYLMGTSLQGMPYASLILIGGKKEINITGSSKNVDFLAKELADYEILGCWVVYGESDYVLCKKEGKFFAAYVNKEKQKVGELEPIKTKKVKGQTAYYTPDDSNHEYLIIMDDGLYIYDETGESGTNAVVWSNDPLWNNK